MDGIEQKRIKERELMGMDNCVVFVVGKGLKVEESVEGINGDGKKFF